MNISNFLQICNFFFKYSMNSWNILRNFEFTNRISPLENRIFPLAFAFDYQCDETKNLLRFFTHSFSICLPMKNVYWSLSTFVLLCNQLYSILHIVFQTRVFRWFRIFSDIRFYSISKQMHFLIFPNSQTLTTWRRWRYQHIGDTITLIRHFSLCTLSNTSINFLKHHCRKVVKYNGNGCLICGCLDIKSCDGLNHRLDRVYPLQYVLSNVQYKCTLMANPYIIMLCSVNAGDVNWIQPTEIDRFCWSQQSLAVSRKSIMEKECNHFRAKAIRFEVACNE